MKRILIGIIAVVLCVGMMPVSVFADEEDGGDSTSSDTTSSDAASSDSASSDSSSSKASVSILHNCAEAEDNNGASIMCLLKLVIDIMTVGVGILGVIGIGVSGVQYLTAGGNEEKTRKAKRRIFEIAIGLVAYVMIYALLSWLLPTFGS